MMQPYGVAQDLGLLLLDHGTNITTQHRPSAHSTQCRHLQQGQNGFTLLLSAAGHGVRWAGEPRSRLEICRLLISQGADPTATTGDGRTVLHHAAERHDTAFAGILAKFRRKCRRCHCAQRLRPEYYMSIGCPSLRRHTCWQCLQCKTRQIARDCSFSTPPTLV